MTARNLLLYDKKQLFMRDYNKQLLINVWGIHRHVTNGAQGWFNNQISKRNNFSWVKKYDPINYVMFFYCNGKMVKSRFPSNVI